MKAKTRIESQMVKYVFTESELRDVGHRMASAIEQQESLENDKKLMTASFNEKIQGAKNNASHLSRCITQGYESRMVDCDVKYDYVAHVVRRIRKDNYETVDEREMTNAELQMEFEDAEQ